MHAMGPNVAGVIGSAIAAGVLLAGKRFVMQKYFAFCLTTHRNTQKYGYRIHKSVLRLS